MGSNNDSLILNIFQSSETKSDKRKIRKFKNANNNNQKEDHIVNRKDSEQQSNRSDEESKTQPMTRPRNYEKVKSKSYGFDSKNSKNFDRRQKYMSSLFQNNPEIPQINLYDIKRYYLSIF